MTVGQTWWRIILKVLGLLAVALGVVGIVLPGLPTTPFLLLALWLFSRSSPRLQHWLLANRLFGRYLEDYRQGRGIPRRVKVYILVVMWVGMALCAVYVLPSWWLRVLLFGVAVGVTWHVGRIKTKHTGQ